AICSVLQSVNKTFTVSTPTAEKIAKYAKLLDCSGNQFVDRAVSALVDLAESSPPEREIPLLVHKIDALSKIPDRKTFYSEGKPSGSHLNDSPRRAA
ncbi:MAG TPA: hypothetical protein VMF06_05390, partial [Candidatus Limnocylindria bacterium]|nr:hypothetical protein [Candidatus Limnocylindria bacterium]